LSRIVVDRYSHDFSFLLLLFVFVQEKSKSYLDQENIKLSAIRSTSQANKQTADVFSAQNLIAGHGEDGSFTTQQLFSFAWQIARGMVTFITSSNIYLETLAQLSDIYSETLNFINGIGCILEPAVCQI